MGRTYIVPKVENSLFLFDRSYTLSCQRRDPIEGFRLLRGVTEVHFASEENPIVQKLRHHGLSVKVRTDIAKPGTRLFAGDRVIVVEIYGLPDLGEQRSYTAEELDEARLSFADYQVIHVSAQ